MSPYFEFSRFRKLVKLEVFRSTRALVMTVVISFGVLYFLGLLMTPVFEPGLVVYEHVSGFAFTLLIGGFILSSLAFNDLGNTLKKYRYLTMPVSALEKFLCMWLFTSLGWILIYTLTYTVFTIFANATGQLIYRHITFLAFDPFGKPALQTIRYYFVLQGVFLVGSAHFRGYVLPKVLFTLIIFGSLCGGLVYLLMSDLFQVDMEVFSDPDLFRGMRSYQVWKIGVWLFWWGLAPLSWVITYLGLKEKEV